MARWPKQDFTSWLAPRSGRWPDVRASVRSESWIVQPPGADSPPGSKWNLKSNDVDSGKPVSPMVNFLADSGEQSEPRVARWSRQCLLNSARGQVVGRRCWDTRSATPSDSREKLPSRSDGDLVDSGFANVAPAGVSTMVLQGVSISHTPAAAECPGV